MRQGRIWVAVIATAALASAVTAMPAAAKDDTIVRPLDYPDNPINGIALGDTRTKVDKSTPLGRKKPQSSEVHRSALGKIRTDIYWSAQGDQLGVSYSVPKKTGSGNSQEDRIFGKKKRSGKVLQVATGSGSWIVANTDITYNTATGHGTPPPVVADYLGGSCVFYQLDASGQRLFNPDLGDGQSCELTYPGNRGFFYFTFNHAGFDADVPAELAGFVLSKYQLP